MNFKSTILFLTSLSLLITPKIKAVEPILPTLIAISAISAIFRTFSTPRVQIIVIDPIREIDPVKEIASSSNDVDTPIDPDDIPQRKRHCAGYRRTIKNLEETLRLNNETRVFYSKTLLRPIGYVRYLANKDEQLKESDIKAQKEIRFFLDLLKEKYCTEADEHQG